MSLTQKIQDDLKDALKSGDATRLGVLRMVNASLKNKSIEKKTKGSGDELTDEDVMQVLMSEAKKRKESADVFKKSGRNDLFEKEQAELEVIQQYLPKQMSKEEAEKAVEEIIKKTGAKDMGSAMKAVMAELKGKVDGKMASEIIKGKLGKL